MPNTSATANTIRKDVIKVKTIAMKTYFPNKINIAKRKEYLKIFQTHEFFSFWDGKLPEKW